MDVKAIKNMVLDILAEADEDLADQYNPDTAEEPDVCEELWCHMLHVVARHLK